MAPDIIVPNPIGKLSPGTINQKLCVVKDDLIAQGLKDDFIDATITNLRGELQSVSWIRANFFSDTEYEDMMSRGAIQTYFAQHPTYVSELQHQHETELRSKTEDVVRLTERCIDLDKLYPELDAKRSQLEQATATIADLRGSLDVATARANTNRDYAIGGGIVSTLLGLGLLYVCARNWLNGKSKN